MAERFVLRREHLQAIQERRAADRRRALVAEVRRELAARGDGRDAEELVTAATAAARRHRLPAPAHRRRISLALAALGGALDAPRAEPVRRALAASTGTPEQRLLRFEEAVRSLHATRP